MLDDSGGDVSAVVARMVTSGMGMESGGPYLAASVLHLCPDYLDEVEVWGTS